MLHILNTSIVPAGPGGVRATVYPIQQQAVRSLLANYQWQSHIGHEATAQIASALTGLAIPMDRTPLALPAAGESCTCVVLQLRGRPPEGRVLTAAEMEALGYDWRLLVLEGVALPTLTVPGGHLTRARSADELAPGELAEVDGALMVGDIGMVQS